MNVVLDTLRILGKRNPRPEGPDKVSGRAKYASDIVLPGMCYGRFLPSPYAAANIMQTLGIHNTAELVVYAIREGLVSIA